ncbi:KH domain protein [Ancylostoma caninum]|uniref:KH domain protein n=1 Tax=Ancylostoma caninum TaxID=29170 RepID=A0A368H6C9_ANCCA|nr:KH domain protein [Ancylostoma caninum]
MSCSKLTSLFDIITSPQPNSSTKSDFWSYNDEIAPVSSAVSGYPISPLSFCEPTLCSPIQYPNVFVSSLNSIRLGMKREHTDDDRYGSSRNSKRQRADGFSEALAQGKFELRILVSSKCAGAIIGKGGENIKRLRTQFEGQISVPDSNSPERVLTLVCPSSVIVRIVEDILPRIEDVSACIY